jgi:cysteinyl-tRNA synthetase
VKIYNTLKHKKVSFKPMAEGQVKMYTCGPTVYYFAHIGNMRSYVVADLLKRVFIYNGYKVKHIMNLTDVGHLVSDANLGEDKMRLTAHSENKSLREIADEYSELFIKDMKRLNLIMPETMPRPSEHITEILNLIEILEKKGYLYTVETGVYYDTSKFKRYGQLMNLNFEELNKYLIGGIRIERPAGTKNTTDFAVWRFVKPEEKDMVWNTKYGRGFPGWHIECSAMSMKYLGEHFDIHTGGIDHLPIHHTNEIAQSESATGKRFVNYWVHNEFLQVDGKKMSKSLRNVYTLQDLIEKGYKINSYKYLVLSAHYRTQLNFTFESLKNAENTLNGIYSFVEKLSLHGVNKENNPNPKFATLVSRIKVQFIKSINDDMNTPLALAKLHLLISKTNKKLDKLSKADTELVLEALVDFDRILGLGFSEYLKQDIPKEVEMLILEREQLRKERKFSEADKIRSILKNEHNIEIEDTEGGSIWHKA